MNLLRLVLDLPGTAVERRTSTQFFNPNGGSPSEVKLQALRTSPSLCLNFEGPVLGPGLMGVHYPEGLEC